MVGATQGAGGDVINVKPYPYTGSPAPHTEGIPRPHLAGDDRPLVAIARAAAGVLELVGGASGSGRWCAAL